MHNSVLKWVVDQRCLMRLYHRSVLEVGSYDVNGSVRPIFHDATRYVGVDIRPGPGVDQIVTPGAPYPFPDSSFDVVVSTEMLEHDPRPWLSVAEMARVVKPEGVVLITARGFDHRGCFPVHDYPGDHWRFSATGMRELLDGCGLDVIYAASDPEAPGEFAAGAKKCGWRP